MHVGIARDLGEDLLRRARVAQVDDDESRRRRVDRIDREKAIEHSVDAADLRRVHAGIGVGVREARDLLGVLRVGEVEDHDRPARALGRDNQQRTVVRDGDIAERRCVGHGDRVDQHRGVAGHVPHVDPVARVGAAETPGRRVRDRCLGQRLPPCSEAESKPAPRTGIETGLVDGQRERRRPSADVDSRAGRWRVRDGPVRASLSPPQATIPAAIVAARTAARITGDNARSCAWRTASTTSRLACRAYPACPASDPPLAARAAS